MPEHASNTFAAALPSCLTWSSRDERRAHVQRALTTAPPLLTTAGRRHLSWEAASQRFEELVVMHGLASAGPTAARV